MRTTFQTGVISTRSGAQITCALINCESAMVLTIAGTTVMRLRVSAIRAPPTFSDAPMDTAFPPFGSATQPTLAMTCLNSTLCKVPCFFFACNFNLGIYRQHMSNEPCRGKIVKFCRRTKAIMKQYQGFINIYKKEFLSSNEASFCVRLVDYSSFLWQALIK